MTDFTGETKLQNQQKNQSLVYCKWCVCSSDSCILFPSAWHIFTPFSFSFVFLYHTSPYLFIFLFSFLSTHLAVMVGHGQQSNGAVGVAAVADGGHVPVPHDWHGGQCLARGVRVRDGVALSARRGQLWAEREVLLNLLVLGLVEVELGVLQVALYLWRKKEAPI